MASLTCEGFVWKSDTKVKHWQKRYMKITADKVLNSYKKQTDSKPKKTFDLKQISTDMLDFSIGDGAPPPFGDHMCVKMHTRMLNLAFESADDKAKWNKAFTAIRDEMYPRGPSPAEIAAAKRKAEEEAKEAERVALMQSNAANEADRVKWAFEVELTKQPFGIGLLSPASGVGNPLVETLRAGSPAHEAGMIMKRDKLLGVNDQVCKDMEYKKLLKYVTKDCKKLLKKGPVVFKFERSCLPYINAGRGTKAEVVGLTVRIRTMLAAAPYTCTFKDGKISAFAEGAGHTVAYTDGTSEVVNLETAYHHLFTSKVFDDAESDEEESKE